MAILHWFIEEWGRNLNLSYSIVMYIIYYAYIYYCISVLTYWDTDHLCKSTIVVLSVFGECNNAQRTPLAASLFKVS